MESSQSSQEKCSNQSGALSQDARTLLAHIVRAVHDHGWATVREGVGCEIEMFSMGGWDRKRFNAAGNELQSAKLVGSSFDPEDGQSYVWYTARGAESWRRARLAGLIK